MDSLGAGVSGGFKRSMAALHILSALPSGWALFVIFTLGSLACYRQEITFWMQPELHVARPAAKAGGTGPGCGVERAFENAHAHLSEWAAKTQAPAVSVRDAAKVKISLPGPRDPIVRLWLYPATSGNVTPQELHAEEPYYFDPATGSALFPRQTAGGDFLSDAHLRLFGTGQAGRVAAGTAALFLIVTLVSGMFVPGSQLRSCLRLNGEGGQRMLRRLHKVAALLALPVSTLAGVSGVLLLAGVFWPGAISVLYPEGSLTFYRELWPEMQEAAMPGAPLVRGGSDAERLTALSAKLWPGRGAGKITLSGTPERGITAELQDAAPGPLASRGITATARVELKGGGTVRIFKTIQGSGVKGAWHALHAAHAGRFASVAGRFLLFFSGVLGAVSIAVGLVLWTEKQVPQRPSDSFAWAYTLAYAGNITFVAGLPLAVAAFFWANRLIPAGYAQRAAAETGVFFCVWAGAFMHALWRMMKWRNSRRISLGLNAKKQAWREQFGAAGVLLVGISVCNAVTGGANMFQAVAAGFWQTASFDAAAIVFGFLFLLLAEKMNSTRRGKW
jgi:uncharacterized iron-regulated membrane protein